MVVGFLTLKMSQDPSTSKTSKSSHGTVILPTTTRTVLLNIGAALQSFRNPKSRLGQLAWSRLHVQACFGKGAIRKDMQHTYYAACDAKMTARQNRAVNALSPNTRSSPAYSSIYYTPLYACKTLVERTAPKTVSVKTSIARSKSLVPCQAQRRSVGILYVS